MITHPSSKPRFRTTFPWQSLLLVLGGSILLASCQAQAATAIAESRRPSPPQEATVVEAVLPDEPAPAAETDSCLDCHSDKDRLIDTARPLEEQPESESSGEG